MKAIILCLSLVLAGCGFRAKFAEPGWYSCRMKDGTIERWDTDDLKPFIALDGNHWIEDKKTGKPLPIEWCTKE